MIEYEQAGGQLDIIDKSAKKCFERYYKRYKRGNKNSGEIEVTGDVEPQNDSWED